MTEVTKLREEVTQARATSVMTVARVTQAERMAQERVVVLASTLRRLARHLGGSPFLRASLLLHARPEMQPKITSETRLTRWLLPIGDG
jgi:hypothetical protein